MHLSNGNTTYSLRNVYEKYLKEFEERNLGKGYVRSDKGSSSSMREETHMETMAKRMKQEKQEEPTQQQRRRVRVPVGRENRRV